jgi:hypothetical protein
VHQSSFWKCIVTGRERHAEIDGARKNFLFVHRGNADIVRQELKAEKDDIAACARFSVRSPYRQELLGRRGRGCVLRRRQAR